MTQPLDVSCFRPLKVAWRKVLDVHKQSKKGPIVKEMFPRLLKKTLENISASQSDNIISGFKATGLYPIDRECVLKKLPEDELDSFASVIIPQELHDMFKEIRYGKVNEKVGRRKKFNIQPGCSVTEDNLFVVEDDTISLENIDNFINTETDEINKTEKKNLLKELNCRKYCD